jgi:hypothetical protein
LSNPLIINGAFSEIKNPDLKPCLIIRLLDRTEAQSENAPHEVLQKVIHLAIANELIKKLFLHQLQFF